MITQYQLTLVPETKVRLSQEVSYRLYAALIHRCSREYGDYVHNIERVPISQYAVRNTDGTISWTINLLGEYTEKEVGSVIESLDSLWLSKENCTVSVKERCKNQIDDVESLMILSEKLNHKVRLSFLSPTSFRSRGKYIVLPSLRLIIQSLIRMLGMTIPEFAVLEKDEPALIDILSSYITISGFSLLDTKYYLKGVEIPSFKGYVLLSIDGDADPKVEKYLSVLLYFSSFSGIGIKTSLGMGGVSCA